MRNQSWKNRCVLSMLVMVVGMLAGCVDDAPTEKSGPDRYPYQVVVTTGMVADIVRQVAGEHAEVKQMMGETVDPHLYSPTTSDMMMLSEAEAIFYSGLHLEGRLTDALVRMARAGKPVVAVTESIPASFLLEVEGEEGADDPHVWMDVNAWSEGVKVIAEALAEFDPTNAEAYRNNAKAYQAELAELDAYVKRIMATIPESSRVLVTAHDAFGYFGRAYGLEVRGVQGISTESEAGIADINDLVGYLVEQKIGAIFIETSVSDQNIKALIEGARSRGHQVTIGGKLFSDAMGPGGTYEGTYIGMIDHNATTITRALGGEAPEDGMNGKLGQ